MTRLRVPASSANLGPGFDSLGLALGLKLECRFLPAEQLSISASGRDSAGIPTDASNLIWRTANQVAERMGGTLPPIALEILNDIPLGKGLGSSAAALTAGIIIANELLQLGWTRGRILDEAARIEGHPDNVAACVLGSVVATVIDEAGCVQAVRLNLPEQVGVAVVVPDFVLPTFDARQVLPASYSSSDAVFNIGRSALLMAALATGALDAFPAALADRLHQPYRYALVPGLREIVALRLPGLLGCALSGAGPSILVFFEKGAESVCENVRAIFTDNQYCAEVLFPGVDEYGYEIWR